MRERDIEDYLVARVKAMGGEVRKVKWIGRRGAPDRLVMVPARFRKWDPFALDQPVQVQTHKGFSSWVELKAPGVKPESYQVREHNRMRAMGLRVEVIDSIQAVEALLR